MYVAIDTETHLISYPDQVNPKGVCLSYCTAGGKGSGAASAGVVKFYDWADSDGEEKDQAEWCRTEHALSDWFGNPECHIVGHNIAFDLHVILRMYPRLWPTVWGALKTGRIHCTKIREQLYRLSTEGDLVGQRYGLADLVLKYLDKDRSAEKEDGWRLRYSELDGICPSAYPDDAYDYALEDALDTLDVFFKQESLRTKDGPGSMNTEAIQVAADFALRGMTLEGILVDDEVVHDLHNSYQHRHVEAVGILRKFGIIRENGTRDQKKLEEYAAEWGVIDRTESGRLSTSRKTLQQLTPTAQIAAYDAYIEYSNTLKAVTTFIPQMDVERIHPQFNVLVNTLRTSCRSSNYYKYKGIRPMTKLLRPKSGRIDPVPSMNFQQIPRDSKFRAAFIPESSHIFLTADYSNLELVCTGQAMLDLVGASKMAEVLNTGVNLHDETGHLIYCDRYGIITREEYGELLAAKDPKAKECRQAAKPVNLGCPGGQSAKTIQRTAKETYGIDITLEQAGKWKEMAMDRFPEFRQFFGNARSDGRIERLRQHQGKYGYAVEVCGAYLANRSYTKAANALLMQTRGALGVKIAMIKLYEACTNRELKSPLWGCSLKALVHDEFVMSVPKHRADRCAEEMAQIMLEGMQQLCPDMRIGIEMIRQKRWGKTGYHEEEYHLCPKKNLETLTGKNT